MHPPYSGEKLEIIHSKSSVHLILKDFNLVQSPIFEMVSAKDNYEKPKAGA
jgi:hypothetical protein